MEWRALIVDGEELARARVRDLLARHRDVTVAGEYENGCDALHAIKRLRPDVLFLDVVLPGLDGFELLRHTPENLRPAVVFTTGHRTYAVEAFEIRALDYLLKPLCPERFDRALQRVRAWAMRSGFAELKGQWRELLARFSPASGNLERFVVKATGRIVIVPAASVDWIETAGNYLLLHVGGERHMIRDSLRSLEGSLDPGKFYRISRSVIVNLDRVKELLPNAAGGHTVVVTTGARLTMTRSLRAWLRFVESGSSNGARPKSAAAANCREGARSRGAAIAATAGPR